MESRPTTILSNESVKQLIFYIILDFAAAAAAGGPEN